ncbi:transcription factor Adf-1-like [Eupeodes corollae]|uniref:transcription factor Adf-1-like n=1 Tax=Eupeodes corollae TaxID=290404 RepID=UPI0024937340|nr:transcription factor Adf-1-like [Eupeodes corollae]
MSKDNMSNHKVDYYALNAKLCKLVESHPCMYDRSAPNYLKKEYVESAWADISQQLKDTVASCRERWRNIRTAYARSVNIYKSPSGPNRHKRYYLHDELQFLTKHLSQGLPSLRILTPSELDSTHENSRQSIDQSEDNNCVYEVINLDSPNSYNQEKAPEEDEEHVPTPEPQHQPERDHELEPELYVDPIQSKKRTRKNSEDFPITSKVPKRDLDFEFVNIILPEIKNMNSRQKILFKGKIFEALEEVLSDSKDFPQKDHISFLSQSAYLNRSTESSQGRQFYGNKLKVLRKEPQRQGSQNSVVKEEIERERDYV